MHRKHKSTKVPNVKLRPRPAAAASSLRDAIADDDESSFDQIIHDRNRLKDAELDQHEANAQAVDEEEADGPLTGANFCFTGVTDDKTALAHAAYQLGAKVEGNLTESTTHLIALTPSSFKYQCALSLGLFILLPQFLFDCLHRWRQAQSLDIDALARRYTLKPLQNLRIGLCGIQDRREREQMKSRLKALGADLVYPMLIQDDVTHLVCGTGDRAESSTLETIYNLKRGRVGQSDERRAADQLHCVRKEWVEDCASVGGRLPEDIYDIWTHRQPPSPAERARLRTSVPSRTFSECKIRFHNAVVTQRRIDERLRREEEEQRRIKLEGQPSKEAVLKKSLAGVAASGVHDKGEGPSKGSSESSLLRIKRAVEITSAKTPTDLQQHPNTAQQQHQSSTRPSAALPAIAKVGTSPFSGGQDHVEQTFSNLVIRLDLSSRDASKESPIKDALLDCGVRQENILQASDRSRVAKFCLTSHSGPSVERWSGYGTAVTTLWLEQCIHYERIIDPSAPTSPAYLRPAGTELPVLGAEDCLISLTGFPVEDEEPERIQLTKCLKEMGCKVIGAFSKRNTHLLSAHPERVKVEGSKECKARSWGIPVVTVDFVTTMWLQGKIDPAPLPQRSVSTGSRASSNTETSAMEETQQGEHLAHLTHGHRRTTSSLCKDITNQTGRSQSDFVEEKKDTEVVGNVKTERSAPKPEDKQNRPRNHSREDSSRLQARYSGGFAADATRSEAIDTQSSSLAGQSMWATRMEGEVTAFLAARRKANSSSSASTSYLSPDNRSGGEAPRRSTSGGEAAAAAPGDTSGLEEDSTSAPGGAISTSATGARRRGKLPPKSRRSTSSGRGGNAVGVSPAPGRRGGTVSPSKPGCGEKEVGEDDQAPQDPAEILLAQRIAAEQHQALARANGHVAHDPLDDSSSAAAGKDVLDPSSGGQGQGRMEEDASIKITYRDPLAERERKRLEDLLHGRGGSTSMVGNKRSREDSSKMENSEVELHQEQDGENGEGESSEMVLIGGPGARLDSSSGKETIRSPRIGGRGRAGAGSGGGGGEESVTPNKKRILARKQPGMGR